MDIPKRSTAQADGGCHIRKTAVDQHHISGIYGNIRTCANGNTNIRSRQSRGIIDTIAYHHDVTILREAADHFFFAIRQNPRDDLVYSCTRSDRLGCLYPVARQHDDMHAHIFQFCDRLRTVLFHLICHTDHTVKLILAGEKERCLSLLCQKFDLMALCKSRKRVLGKRCDKFFLATVNAFATPQPRQTIACHALKSLYRIRDNVLCLSVGDHCFGKRMFALAFQGCRQCQ